MSRSKLTFQKRERERAKALKKQEKRQRKSEKKDSDIEPAVDQGSELVGKVVFSLSSGVGRITSISQMELGSGDFLVVNFKDSTAVDYIRIDGTYNFRILSSDDEFQTALAELKSKTTLTNFDSKKDRVHYFKALEQKYSLASLVELIKQMSKCSDLGAVEKKILQRGIDSLIEEHKIHTGLALDESREKIEYLISA